MSTTSRIVEEVSADLLRETGFSTVESVDFDSSEVEGNEVATYIKNPFMFDVRHFLPNNRLMDLDRFFEITQDLVKDAQEREGIVTGQHVQVIEEYPASRINKLGNEVIAWKIVHRKPAAMDTSGKGRQQKHFTPYYSVRSPKYPNKILDIESRPLDHLIEFQCWSKSARLANRRAIWLERLFVNHAWAYIAQGTDRFYFHDRTADWYTNVSGQHLYVRPIRVSVRTYEFRIKADPVIKHITLNAGTTNASGLTTQSY